MEINRTMWLVVVIALILSVGSVLGLATAQAQGRNALRECFGPGALTMEEAEMKCTKVEGGEWTAVGGDDRSAGIGGFVFLAILLTLAAAIAGGYVADSVGVSPGLGMFAGLVFSWLGVFGIYLYGDAIRKRSTPA